MLSSWTFSAAYSPIRHFGASGGTACCFLFLKRDEVGYRAGKSERAQHIPTLCDRLSVGCRWLCYSNVGYSNGKIWRLFRSVIGDWKRMRHKEL